MVPASTGATRPAPAAIGVHFMSLLILTVGEFAGKDRTGRAALLRAIARPRRKPPRGGRTTRSSTAAAGRPGHSRLPLRRFQQPGDDVGRLASLASRKSRVHVQGRRRVGVAEATAHRANWNAGGEKLSRVEVAEVVEADASEAEATAQALK